jgi:hypothetical protein
MFLSGKKDREAKGIKRCATFSPPEGHERWPPAARKA